MLRKDALRTQKSVNDGTKEIFLNIPNLQFGNGRSRYQGYGIDTYEKGQGPEAHIEEVFNQQAVLLQKITCSTELASK